MADCSKCGGSGDIPFRVLEVHTLHIRDLDGEKWVQALGEFREFAVCGSCAKAFLERALQPGISLGKKLLPYLAVLVFGAAVTAVCRTGEFTLRLLGAAGMICGAVGTVSVLRDTAREKARYAALPLEEALRTAAWACLIETVPKKAGENDLTYIPANQETLSLEWGKLSSAYDLLPAVAEQAWNRLHGAEMSEPEKSECP